jgi:hypothetical protein
VRRPLAAAAVVATAAHHTFELAAGVGLVWQPQLGLAGAAALWGVQLPAWAAVAARGGRRWDPAVAVLSGAALAGAAVHYTVWPWRWGRLGIPRLTEAEGLRPELLGAYNTILRVWAVAAAASLIAEIEGRRRWWGAVGVAAMPVLRASARHHFEWAAEQARLRPAWWNRGLRPSSAATEVETPAGAGA